jgi:hypothetical protein
VCEQVKVAVMHKFISRRTFSHGRSSEAVRFTGRSSEATGAQADGKDLYNKKKGYAVDLGCQGSYWVGGTRSLLCRV